MQNNQEMDRKIATEERVLARLRNDLFNLENDRSQLQNDVSYNVAYFQRLVSCLNVSVHEIRSL